MVLRKLLCAPALALAVLASSCDTFPPTENLSAPEDVLSAKAPPGLVRAQSPGLDKVRGSADMLIDTEGGRVSAGGHSISVPADAVTGATSFTLAVLDGEHVEVFLTAIANPGLPNAVNVGANGFANGKSVTITLSYAEAADVTDPAKLTCVRVLATGELEVLATSLNAAAQTISCDTPKFSRYAMATH